MLRGAQHAHMCRAREAHIVCTYIYTYIYYIYTYLPQRKARIYILHIYIRSIYIHTYYIYIHTCPRGRRGCCRGIRQASSCHEVRQGLDPRGSNMHLRRHNGKREHVRRQNGNLLFIMNRKGRNKFLVPCSKKSVCHPFHVKPPSDYLNCPCFDLN